MLRGMVTSPSVGYLSDLADAEWELVQPLLPPPAARGRPRQQSLRTILHAVFYLVRAGGAWRLPARGRRDRKSTRLNSSHTVISYAVFCLEKKTHMPDPHSPRGTVGRNVPIRVPCTNGPPWP